MLCQGLPIQQEVARLQRRQQEDIIELDRVGRRLRDGRVALSVCGSGAGDFKRQAVAGWRLGRAGNTPLRSSGPTAKN